MAYEFPQYNPDKYDPDWWNATDVARYVRDHGSVKLLDRAYDPDHGDPFYVRPISETDPYVGYTRKMEPHTDLFNSTMLPGKWLKQKQRHATQRILIENGHRTGYHTQGRSKATRQREKHSGAYSKLEVATIADDGQSTLSQYDPEHAKRMVELNRQLQFGEPETYAGALKSGVETAGFITHPWLTLGAKYLGPTIAKVARHLGGQVYAYMNHKNILTPAREFLSEQLYHDIANGREYNEPYQYLSRDEAARAMLHNGRLRGHYTERERVFLEDYYGNLQVQLGLPSPKLTPRERVIRRVQFVAGTRPHVKPARRRAMGGARREKIQTPQSSFSMRNPLWVPYSVYLRKRRRKLKRWARGYNLFRI